MTLKYGGYVAEMEEGHRNKRSNEHTKKAPMFRNSIEAFKVMGRRFPHSRWQIPLYIFYCIAAPFMSTLIPSLSIKAILQGEVKYFLISITLALCAYWGMEAVRNLVSLYLEKARTFTMSDVFFGNFIKKCLKTDYANIEPQEKQMMIARAERVVHSGGDSVSQVISESVEFMIKVLGLLIYGTAILLLDVKILLITVALLVMDVLMRNYAVRYTDTHWQEVMEVWCKQWYLRSNCMNVGAGKDIRIYQLKGWFHERFDELIRQEADFQKRTQIRWYYPTIVDNVCSFVKNLLAYSILAGKVLAGDMDVAGFILYLGVIFGLDEWIFPMALSYGRLKSATCRFSDYQEFMDTPDIFTHGGGGGFKRPEGALEITFRDVSFSYEMGGKRVLSHIDFVIKPGESVALVGNNGAGKTTLVKLLCGFYPVTEGEILINGRNINEMEIDDYQEMVSVLFQDTTSLAFTIAMNVSGCSNEKMDRERVRESLRRAGLWDKVSGLPRKEDTYLSRQLDDDGIWLSGGEMQKLLLARALYRNGQIMILDEPTASLDPIAESKVYEDYHMLTAGKTSLFISHRLASTRFCDRIIFLENGRVAEVGSHEELMKESGRYKEMFDIQSKYYQEQEESAIEE